MKKFLTILLTISMALTMTACTGCNKKEIESTLSTVTSVVENVNKNVTSIAEKIDEIEPKTDLSKYEEVDVPELPEVSELPEVKETPSAEDNTLKVDAKKETEYTCNNKPVCGMTKEELTKEIETIEDLGYFDMEYFNDHSLAEYRDFAEIVSILLIPVNDVFDYTPKNIYDNYTYEQKCLCSWYAFSTWIDDGTWRWPTDEKGTYATTDLWICSLAKESGIADYTFGEYFGVDAYKLFPFVPGNSITLGEYAQSVYDYMPKLNRFVEKYNSEIEAGIDMDTAIDNFIANAPYRYIHP